MARVRAEQRGDGRLRVAWEQPGEQTTRDVGRGRGAVPREQRVIQTSRAPITPLTRPADTMAALGPRFGGQACGTQAPHRRLSVQEAVWGERHAYRGARLCNRLKRRGPMAPLCVTLHAQSEGLTSLLTRGVRGCTVTACVRRRSLETKQARRPGLPPANTHKRTDTPTAARIRNAVSDIALTRIKHAAGEDMLRRLPPLSGVQEEILQRRGWGAAL